MTELRKRSRPFGVVVVDGSTADTPDAINVVAVEILAETAMSVIGTSLHSLHRKKFGRYWVYSGLCSPAEARL
jgi:hypothetical protein